MEKKIVSRRDFVKAAGVAAAASVLAACGPTTVEVVKTVEVPKEVQVTQVVKEKVTEIVTQEKVVTATPLPTKPPEPVVMDVWFNCDIPDLNADWKPDPENEFFKKYWHWLGLGQLIFKPWLEKHPGVSLKITQHSWDAELRQNQLMALAAGLVPDTTYGEAYVNEFVQLQVYSPVDPKVASLFAEGSVAGGLVGGNYYAIPKSSGACVLQVNMTTWEKAGLDRTKMPTTWDELVTACEAISKVNKSEKYGNNAYYTYDPSGETYGCAMRILQWFNQNGCPLGDNEGHPTANAPKAADTWFFHNKLMWSSSETLITQAESEAGSGQLFNDGVIAIKPGWDYDAFALGLTETPPDADAILFPLPPGGKPSTIVVGNDMHSALKYGPNPDLAVVLVEESLVNPEAQAYLADHAGIWIPALKSLLENPDTYDKLGGYKNDVAKKACRVTMKALLNGGSTALPGWPKNGTRVWTAWNTSGHKIWKEKMKVEDIQTELDGLQKAIEGLLVKTG